MEKERHRKACESLLVQLTLSRCLQSQAHAAAAAAEKEAVEMLSEELRVLEPSVSGTKAELEERLVGAVALFYFLPSISKHSTKPFLLQNHALTNQVLADEDEQNKYVMHNIVLSAESKIG